MLSVRTNTIEEFALFYQKLGTCKESAVGLQIREEYVKSIFEVSEKMHVQKFSVYSQYIVIAYGKLLDYSKDLWIP